MGYKDGYQNDDNEFENQLVCNLAEFIQTEGQAPWVPSSSEMSLDGRMTVMGSFGGNFASNMLSGTGQPSPAYCSSSADTVEVSPSMSKHLVSNTKGTVIFDLPRERHSPVEKEVLEHQETVSEHVWALS